MSQESLLGPYLKPGTPIKVGSYSTKIIRYLSEGGFSHVYIARLDIPVKGSDVAVLKRIVATDKLALAAIRTEVETMKKLKGHRYIVTYIDSHASALTPAGFEVYVLMEYCPGGGLIDFMNTRLQTRLAEWEVLKIISDTTEAVACMHYLRPPLLHRDLKIENVLISGNGDYKLCDFGSCTEPRAAATSSQERRDLEDDIQKNTTIQYRSPEMVDVSRRLPIDEKSDIWALGVLLYKLCYFTTPFEAQGPLAILNAAYTFPPYPPYTDRTKRLIAVTLQENPRVRPNIYQLLAEICAMRNVPVPIPDIYSKKRESSTGRTSRPSSRPPTAHNNDDILTYEAAAATAPKTPVIPTADVVPMRRGRPEKTTSPARTDPTDQTYHRSISRPNTHEVPIADAEEFSTKFPSLEEMDQTLSLKEPLPGVDEVSPSSRVDKTSQTVTTRDGKRPSAKLPDAEGSPAIQAFKPNTLTLPRIPDTHKPEATDVNVGPSRQNDFPKLVGNRDRNQANISQGPRTSTYTPKNTDPYLDSEARIPSTGAIPVTRPKPAFSDGARPVPAVQSLVNHYSHSPRSENLLTERLQSRPQMVSRASQTSPKPKQAVQTQTSPPKKVKPINYGPSADTGLSSNLMRDSSGLVIPRAAYVKEQSATAATATAVNTDTLIGQTQYRFSTTLDRPNERVRAQNGIERSKSAAGGRPSTIHVDSNIDFLGTLDSPLTGTTLSDSLGPNRTGSSLLSDSSTRHINSFPAVVGPEIRVAPISANVRRSVSVSASNRHNKRPSINSIPSFSGAAKNLMSGKFGDAFKKFETTGKGKLPTHSGEQSNPLQVAEDDLPEHITQHLHSAEARRSSSYTRSRPSQDVSRLDGKSGKLEEPPGVEGSSTSVKEAKRRLKEKASQAYVPSQRTAQGYGKYTEPETIHRAATVIPYARTPSADKAVSSSRPSKWGGKNPHRYGFQEEDEDSGFSNRFPPLNDDFKV